MVKIYINSIGVTNPEIDIRAATIYQCYQNGRLVHSPDTEGAALQWLSENGGGIYQNVLHHVAFPVEPDEFKNLIP